MSDSKPQIDKKKLEELKVKKAEQLEKGTIITKPDNGNEKADRL